MGCKTLLQVDVECLQVLSVGVKAEILFAISR